MGYHASTVEHFNIFDANHSVSYLVEIVGLVLNLLGD
jgi:hypothetical protein